jgi:PAS domain S-box-containing protein
MGTPLRVLIVEDSEEDTLLIVRELKRGGFDPIHEQVETAEAMTAALEKHPWDIIISDYVMPHFSGLEALKLFKASGLDLPFIIVSGSIGEDVAVETMKSGAHDYLMKNNLTRLIPAIQQELHGAEVRRNLKHSEKALQEAEKRYRQVLENATEIIYAVDVKGNFTYGNPAGLKVTGYSLGELRQLNYTDLVHPEHRERISQVYIKQFRERRPTTYIEFPFFSKAGEIIWFGQNTSLVIEDGKVVGFHMIARDITERKRAEEALKESEEKYRLVVENGGDAILIAQDGMIKFINPKATEILGYSYDEFISRPFVEFIHPEDKMTVLKFHLERIKGERPPEIYSFRVVDKDRNIRWMEINVVSITWNEKPATLNFLRDITERKQAEEALRVSHRFLEIANQHTSMNSLLNEFVVEVQRLTKCAAVGIRILDEEENIPYQAYKGFSQRFYESESPLSIKSDQCMCINVIKGVTDPKLPFYTEGGSFYINATTRFLATVSEEEKGKTRNECNRAGFESVALVPIRMGKQILGLIHIADPHEDMIPLETLKPLEQAAIQLGEALQRLRAEEALRRAEENFRRSLDDSPLGVRVVTTEGETIYANRAILDIYGYDSIEELRTTPIKKRYTPESYAEFNIRKEKRQRGEYYPSEYEISIVRENGEIRRLQVFRKEVFWNGGRQFQTVYQDITERKRIEEILRSSEEKYRTILETIEEGYLEVDLAGNFTFVNDAECRNLGYTREELVGMDNRQYTDETTAKKLYQTFNGVYRTGEPVKVLEVEVIRKDGTKALHEISVSLVRDSEGKPIGFRCIARDVTERKRAEQEMAALQEQLRQSQKIEAIGRLAGGIAHDFNNLLTVIKGYSQLSLTELKEDVPLRGNIEEIKRASEKATDLTRQLLAFSRRQILEMKVLDLNTVLRDMDKMLHRLIGEDIELITLLVDDLGRVKIDPGWVE